MHSSVKIEPVCNLPVEPAGAVNCLLAINPVPGKNDHAADRVAYCPERFVLFLSKQLRDPLQSKPTA